MGECWVFNRAMVWLDKDCGVDGGILCYSSQSPLPLTGKRQVSRWYAGLDNDLADVDDQFTRLTKRNVNSAWDHACLPPFQFAIEQHRTASSRSGRRQSLAVRGDRQGPQRPAAVYQPVANRSGR